nr:hypothetical transcript [Hymenolepis microstoma]
MTWPALRVVFNQLLFWLANSSELKKFLHNDVDFHEASQYSCQLLSNCIDLSFHGLRRNFLELVKYLSPCLLFPGDYDQQDDIRLDDKPLPPNENIQLAMPGTMEPHIQQLLQCLALMMRRMCQACVNTELKQNTGSLWTTRLGAGRLMRRLQRIKQWASRHGLGSAWEINLLLPIQTCQLITADRSKFRPF